MVGANNKAVKGQTDASKILDSLTGKGIENDILNSVANRNAAIGFIKDTVDKKELKK